jgi:hypothetical protein
LQEVNFTSQKKEVRMTSVQKTKLVVMKYDPVWRKLSETKVPENTSHAAATKRSPHESLQRLNKIASGYPFCIMYHMKEHDPL